MIETIISWSIHNRFFVWLGIIMIVVGGFYAIKETPVDALPDLSENQVIIFTEYMGRNPKIMEDQITYPLVSNLQGIPRIKSIRAASMFGMSFIFVVFKDDVDVYWARTRVLERLNYAQKFEAGIKCGLCGQALSDYPEYAKFLVDHDIQSISFNPDALTKGIENIALAEEGKTLNLQY
ncbi:efflux RND transporter permease subunit [Chitinophaga sp. CF418]|uniref:efflux RND transporter permease subunit n=1 Tax=Chitinophaga sp. CF418 TaxID=1855287 RepID=UPI00090EBBF7|nr:efflux RND transporter permease subunit [Chitinophaga sp. CF418]SHN34259.1 AcrB/AcrD/AcrF family protein [Chitinophaga sp. CF418]